MNILLKRYYSLPVGEHVAPYLAARKAVRHSTPVFNLPSFKLGQSKKSSYIPRQSYELPSQA